MRRISSFVLMTCLALAAAACGAPQTPPPGDVEMPKAAEPASVAGDDEVCPTADATTTPPTCPADCIWDGAKCKKQRGIIVDQ
jgi:hypothetical protein